MAAAEGLRAGKWRRRRGGVSASAEQIGLGALVHGNNEGHPRPGGLLVAFSKGWATSWQMGFWSELGGVFGYKSTKMD